MLCTYIHVESQNIELQDNDMYICVIISVTQDCKHNIYYLMKCKLIQCILSIIIININT